MLYKEFLALTGKEGISDRVISYDQFIEIEKIYMKKNTDKVIFCNWFYNHLQNSVYELVKEKIDKNILFIEVEIYQEKITNKLIEMLQI